MQTEVEVKEETEEEMCERCEEELPKYECIDCNDAICSNCFFKESSRVRAVEFTNEFRQQLITKQQCLKCWLAEHQNCEKCIFYVVLFGDESDQESRSDCVVGSETDDVEGTEPGDCDDWRATDKYKLAAVPIQFPIFVPTEVVVLNLRDTMTKDLGKIVIFPQWEKSVRAIIEQVQQQEVYSSDDVVAEMKNQQIPYFTFEERQIDF
jgi:hypothetical protein